MHETMRRVQRGDFLYYTCTKLHGVRHAFTTKAGGVSEGDCASLNLGFGRGDDEENVRRNYHILADALDLSYNRITLTHQVHRDEVSRVTEDAAGMGLTRPMAWESDAIITALPNTPLVGFGADCVVTLLYDPVACVCGVCHAGWRGTAAGIVRKTVGEMVRTLGAVPENLIAVLGPSIRQCCFETDEDVPRVLAAQLGACAAPYVRAADAAPAGKRKYHVDLQGINMALLAEAGLRRENIIDSGICTCCEHETFWSHRATGGRRGVQGAILAL